MHIVFNCSSQLPQNKDSKVQEISETASQRQSWFKGFECHCNHIITYYHATQTQRNRNLKLCTDGTLKVNSVPQLLNKTVQWLT